MMNYKLPSKSGGVSAGDEVFVTCFAKVNVIHRFKAKASPYNHYNGWKNDLNPCTLSNNQLEIYNEWNGYKTLQLTSCCCCLVINACLTLLWPIDYQPKRAHSAHGTSGEHNHYKRFIIWIYPCPALAEQFFTSYNFNIIKT